MDQNSELSKAAAQLAELKRRRAMLESLTRQERELEERESALRAKRKSEQRDVDRLECGSLAALFYEMLGKKAEKLDKEKTEAREAAVRHDTVLRQLNAVRDDLAVCREKLAQLSGCEARHNRLLEEKMAALRASGSPYAEALRRLEEQIGRLNQQVREIDEAANVGQMAVCQVRAIQDGLDRAQNWGAWDLLGGGLIADFAKHSHLNEAQRQIESLQVLLRRFRTELEDVAISADIHVQTEGFLLFADLFFDDIFSSFAVLNQIRDSKAQLATVGRQIDTVLARLSGLKDGIGRELEDLTEKRQALALRADADPRQPPN